jgi:hypothetical protein
MLIKQLDRSAAAMRIKLEDTEKNLAEENSQPFSQVTQKPAPASSSSAPDDTPTKRRNLFRRALKGLSSRSHNDLKKVEDMLTDLLLETETLKHAQNINHENLTAIYQLDVPQVTIRQDVDKLPNELPSTHEYQPHQREGEHEYVSGQLDLQHNIGIPSRLETPTFPPFGHQLCKSAVHVPNGFCGTKSQSDNQSSTTHIQPASHTGSDTITIFPREGGRSNSPCKGNGMLPACTGALAAIAAASVADTVTRKHRNESHNRDMIETSIVTATRPNGKHKSKPRASRTREEDVAEGKISTRRRSKGLEELVVSPTKSRALSSGMISSRRSYDSPSSSKAFYPEPQVIRDCRRYY